MSVLAVALTAIMCNGPLGNLEQPEKDCTTAVVSLTVGHKMCDEVRDVYLSYQKPVRGKHSYLSCAATDGDGSDITIIPLEGQSDSIGYSEPSEPTKPKPTTKGLRT